VASMLYRLGATCARHRWRVIGVWLIVLVAAVALAGAVRQPVSTAFSVPGTQSQRAIDLLDTHYPGAGGAQAQIVFSTAGTGRLTSPARRTAIEASLALLRRAPEVVAVTDPFRGGTVSADGRIAFATVAYPVSVDKVSAAAKSALLHSGGVARRAGLVVDIGGAVAAPSSTSSTDVLGLIVALLVLALTFGSALAAAIPLVTALVGVGTALAGILALSAVVSESSTAPILATMIGLAVGIDYALFISTRHRQQLVAGTEVGESIARAVATAGSAVCFAGTTVVVALAALVVARIPFLTVMGLCGAAGVFIAVAVALTLVPALLSLLGDRLLRAGRARRQIARQAAPGYRAAGRRWVEFVTRRPGPVIVVAAVALLTLASPALHIRLALPDAGTQPTSETDRRAYDLISKGFGPGFNGPLLLVIAASKAENPIVVARGLAKEGRGIADIASVSAPLQNPSRTVTLVDIVPKSGPTDPQTKTLVAAIRQRAALVRKHTGAVILVTGTTAVNIDASARLAAALPPYLAVVVLLCLLLLTLVFRSLLVPLKAVVGYLLSVAAALGAVTWVFQGGRLRGFFGVPTSSPVVSFVPILLLGVLFGLAMDYEVFLVTPIREAHSKRDDPVANVVTGYTASARVVAAAAIIMTSVFASFITTEDLIVKSIGFTLAFGVLVDAFVVRMTLVPAVLALLGRAAWWLPRWLAAVLPTVAIEDDNVRARGEPDSTGTRRDGDVRLEART
jgi:RND superfamily putative drug exporter